MPAPVYEIFWGCTVAASGGQEACGDGTPGLRSGIMTTKIFNRRTDVVFREVAGENLLVPIRGELADLQRIFSVNAVGGCIWELLDGRRSLAAIAETVSQRFDGFDSGRVALDVADFVQELVDAKLAFEVT